MKTLFLTNNINVALPLFEWIKKKEGIDNVILFCERIAASQFSVGEPFYGIEFIISYNYSHIIKQEVILLFPHKIINLHTSMLPWNKGASPNIWSFLEGTPSGVTIHEVDAGLDTGDILLQREIIFNYKTDTLKSSYKKSHVLINELFRDNWVELKNGLIKPKPQSGTKHYKKDSHMFDHIIDYNDTIDKFIHKYKELKKQPTY